MRRLLAIAVLVALAACSGKKAPAPAEVAPAPEAPAPAAATPTPEAPPATRPARPPFQKTEALPAFQGEAPAFVDKVWRVAPGGEQEAGTTYTFLRDGTLLIDQPHGTPSRGAWRYAGDKVTMIEEGVAYPADVITLDADHFVLRSYNPGGSVDIRMDSEGAAPPHP